MKYQWTFDKKKRVNITQKKSLIYDGNWQKTKIRTNIHDIICPFPYLPIFFQYIYLNFFYISILRHLISFKNRGPPDNQKYT